MKLILDSKLEQEMIDRFAYMYDVFHTYMLVNKKTDYYIEASSFPKNGFEYTSSRIRTVTDSGQTLFATKYGKIEANLRISTQ